MPFWRVLGCHPLDEPSIAHVHEATGIVDLTVDPPRVQVQTVQWTQMIRISVCSLTSTHLRLLSVISSIRSTATSQQRYGFQAQWLSVALGHLDADLHHLIREDLVAHDGLAAVPRMSGTSG